jgi:hypothetical protein
MRMLLECPETGSHGICGKIRSETARPYGAGTMRIRILLGSVLLVGTSACAGTPLIPGGGSELNKAPSPVAITADPHLAAAGFEGEERTRIDAVQPIVRAAAKRHGVDPELINGVIWVESRFNTKAKSPAGARGLMQLMPATAAYLAKELGASRPRSNDPEFNIDAGTYYLSRLLDRFEGDETLAVAAYNAGPGNVKSWQAEGRPLPEYSQSYVEKVFTARARFSMRGPDAATEAPAVAAATREIMEVADPQPAVHSVVVRVDDPVVPEPPEIVEEAVFAPAPELDHEPELPAPAPVAAPAPTASAATPAPTPTALPSPPQPADVGAGVLPDIALGQ